MTAIDAEFKETTALAVRTEHPPAAPQLLDALRPAERVALMAEISGVVADVIKKQGWFVDIKGKKHITIHGWTFVGSLAGCSVKTTGYEKIDGGYKAHASVVRVDSGIEVGSAEQVCMKAEAFGRGKDDYALIGMASTRACSRALATTFRHVVELAGYSATPAEEMNKDDKPLPSSRGNIEPREGYRIGICDGCDSHDEVRKHGDARNLCDGCQAKRRPPAPSVAELVDIARGFGITDFIGWAATQIDASIATRKRMNDNEKREAKRLLDEMVPEPALAPEFASDLGKKKVTRDNIMILARKLWPDKEEQDRERKRAMKVHRCGTSLKDDVLPGIQLSALIDLERDLGRRWDGRAVDPDDLLDEYAAEKLA